MTIGISAIFKMLAVMILMAFPVQAEVMDKELTSAAMWSWAIVGGVTALILWPRSRWAGFLVSCSVLIRLLTVYNEIYDPFVGPAIRSEAGHGYVTQFYLAIALAVVLHGAAAYQAFRRSRRRAA